MTTRKNKKPKALIKNIVEVYKTTIESIIRSFYSDGLANISAESLLETSSFLYTVEHWLEELNRKEEKPSYIETLYRMNLEVKRAQKLIMSLRQDPQRTYSYTINSSSHQLEQLLSVLKNLQSILARLDKEI